MSDLSFAHVLFFALPGFYTLFLVRHIASYKYDMTHAQFVFYSLALSIPSYIAATAIVGADDATLIVAVQSGIAMAGGGIAGCVLKKAWRSKIIRETPWYSFMLGSIGDYVVVHTASKSYYGWVKSASSDDEPRRELVLGEPRRIMDDGTHIRLGAEMVFVEAEIARVLRVRFDNGAGPAEPGA